MTVIEMFSLENLVCKKIGQSKQMRVSMTLMHGPISQSLPVEINATTENDIWADDFAR